MSELYVPPADRVFISRQLAERLYRQHNAIALAYKRLLEESSKGDQVVRVPLIVEADGDVNGEAD